MAYTTTGPPGGTIMPAADANALGDDDIFDIIFYVRSITEEYDVARVTERRRAEAAAAAQHEAEGGHDEAGAQ